MFNKPLSIAISKPEAVLEYVDILLKLFEWTKAVRVLDMYEGYHPPTELSRKLRVMAFVGAGQVDDALTVLNDMDPDSTETIYLELTLVSARIRQLFRDQSNRKFTINTESDPETDVYQQAVLSKYQNQRYELIEKLLDLGSDKLKLSLLISVCNLHVKDNNVESAKALIEKYLVQFPSSIGAKVYSRLLLEPDPVSVSDQRSRQINVEAISEIEDELLRSKTLCQYYLSKNLVGDALEELKKAHSSSPDDGEVIGLLFDVALQADNIELAEQMALKAGGMNLDECNGSFFAARLDYARKDYRSALQKADECLDFRPVFAYGYLLRSQINVGLDNNDRAIADAETAAKTNPVDGVTAKHRAALLHERNLNLGRDATPDQVSEAEKAILAAVILNPNDWRLRSLYSEMVSRLDPHRALAMRQQLLETNPNTENNLMLGNMASRLALDNSDESEKNALLEIAGSAYARAYAMEPGSEIVLNAYSEFLRISDQQDKALQLLGRQEGVLWQFYLRDGQYDKARDVLEKLYTEDPGDEVIVRGLLVVAGSTADNDGLKRYSDELLTISDTTTNELLQIQMYLEAGLIWEANLKLASFRERNPDNAGGILLDAWAAMTNGLLEKALVLANQSLEIDPESATAWRLRGQINRLSGNFNDAVEDLQKSKSIDANPQTRLDLARLYHRTGRTAAAIGELAAALDNPGAPLLVRTMLEQLYLESGRTNDLNSFYEECLKKYPDGSLWYFRSGKFALDQKEYEQAQALLERACELSESDADRMFALDYYFESLLLGENYQKLLKEASKYIDTQFAPVAYSQMAQVQLKLGNRATSVDYFRKAIERSGADDALISGVLQNMEDVIGIAEVLRWCSQRLSAEPDSLAANLAMYKLAERRGDYNKAIGYANKCMEITGTQSPAWIKYAFYKASLLTLAYQKTSDKNYLSSAISEFEAILARQPDNTSVMNNLAVLLADGDEQVDKAVKYAKSAHEAAPNNANRMDTYAYTLCKTGDFAKAREMAQRAIQVYELSGTGIPWDVYNHLGMAMEGLGRRDEAATAYRQALEVAGETVSQTHKQELTKAIERVL
ncbi:MAG: tetratricopeptide repeat protein [Planctomycetes bacterium]|nr:tetratricopeptide repeat protein [Planctomycetota bacterium]